MLQDLAISLVVESRSLFAHQTSMYYLNARVIILLLLVSKNNRLPYWNSTSGIYTVSQKTSTTFLAGTRESIVGFS